MLNDYLTRIQSQVNLLHVITFQSCLSFSLFVCLSVYLYACEGMSDGMYVCQNICMYVKVCQSFCLSVCLNVFMSSCMYVKVCLSV